MEVKYGALAKYSEKWRKFPWRKTEEVEQTETTKRNISYRNTKLLTPKIGINEQRKIVLKNNSSTEVANIANCTFPIRQLGYQPPITTCENSKTPPFYLESIWSLVKQKKSVN